MQEIVKPLYSKKKSEEKIRKSDNQPWQIYRENQSGSESNHQKILRVMISVSYAQLLDPTLSTIFQSVILIREYRINSIIKPTKKNNAAKYKTRWQKSNEFKTFKWSFFSYTFNQNNNSVHKQSTKRV